MRSARKPVVLVVVCLAISAVLGGSAYAASSLYGQFGAPRTPVSAVSWAERPQTYLVSDCAGCHPGAVAQAAGTAHQPLICESCHVPTVDHPGPVEGVIQMLSPVSDETCVSCHERTAARPAAVAQVVLTRHYSGSDCIACHEPHSAVAVAPRVVTHPLANLPGCSVCHAPDGLKQFPANHEVAPDSVCLGCHRLGAGDP